MDKKERPAQIFAKRLRMSFENEEVIEKIAILRRKNQEEYVSSQIISMQNPTIYSK